jgi:hypothetical protein
MWSGQQVTSFCDNVVRSGGGKTLVNPWLEKKGHEKCFCMCFEKQVLKYVPAPTCLEKKVMKSFSNHVVRKSGS